MTCDQRAEHFKNMYTTLVSIVVIVAKQHFVYVGSSFVRGCRMVGGQEFGVGHVVFGVKLKAQIVRTKDGVVTFVSVDGGVLDVKVRIDFPHAKSKADSEVGQSQIHFWVLFKCQLTRVFDCKFKLKKSIRKLELTNWLGNTESEFKSCGFVHLMVSTYDTSRKGFATTSCLNG